MDQSTIPADGFCAIKLPADKQNAALRPDAEKAEPHAADESSSLLSKPDNRQDGKNEGSHAQNGMDAFFMRILRSPRNLGLMYMLISACAFSVMSACVKIAGLSGLSTWEIMFGRSVVVNTFCLGKLAHRRIKPWGDR